MRADVIVKLDTMADEATIRQALAECARALGVTFAPVHAATADRDLASYFMASLDATGLDATLDRLRRCPGIEAAYAKPQGAPPGRM